MPKLEFIVNETIDTLCEKASKLDDEGEAQVLLLQAYAMKPNDKTVNYNLGILYQHWDNHCQAIKHFEQSIPIGESYFHLGNLYKKKGDILKSRESFINGEKNGCKKCSIDIYTKFNQEDFTIFCLKEGNVNGIKYLKNYMDLMESLLK